MKRNLSEDENRRGQIRIVPRFATIQY